MVLQTSPPLYMYTMREEPRTAHKGLPGILEKSRASKSRSLAHTQAQYAGERRFVPSVGRLFSMSITQAKARAGVHSRIESLGIVVRRRAAGVGDARLGRLEREVRYSAQGREQVPLGDNGSCVLQGKTWTEDGRTGVAGNSTRRTGRGIWLRCCLDRSRDLGPASALCGMSEVHRMHRPTLSPALG